MTDDMKFLSPEQIREQKTLVWEPLEVPEWADNGARWVRVKMLSARESDEFEASMIEIKNGQMKPNRVNARARLVQLALINEDGSKMFTRNDIKALGELPAAGLQRVFNKVSEMSNISEQDMRDMTEGFDDGPDEPSPSD